MEGLTAGLCVFFVRRGGNEGSMPACRWELFKSTKSTSSKRKREHSSASIPSSRLLLGRRTDGATASLKADSERSFEWQA